MNKLNDKRLQEYLLISDSEEDTDFIPLISDEDEVSIVQTVIPDALPILPLRNTVLFPGVIIPITVGRDKSMKLVQGTLSEIQDNRNPGSKGPYTG
jgi:ATP-dependent Lon protease